MCRGVFPDGKSLPNLTPLPGPVGLFMATGGAFSVGAVGQHADGGVTDVVLEFPARNAESVGVIGWHAPGFMPPFLGAHMMSAGNYIQANMTVQKPGSNAPSTFPVKFFRHEMPVAGESGARVSYKANTTYALSEDGGSFFTFNGEILVKNDSAFQHGYVTVTANDSYDNEIAMGETAYHQAQVTGEATEFNFDLKWSDPNDSLRLVVYTPDGHILGPYTDSSDGKVDGRINMEVDNPGGVADGAWVFKVTGTDVAGKDEYYIRTW